MGTGTPPPHTLDQLTTVKAQKDLRKFHVFLPSYYSVKGFTSSSVWVKSNPQAGGKPGFLEATKAMGELMSYPRDDQGAKLGQAHLGAFWKILPFYAGALARRYDAATGLSGLMIAGAVIRWRPFGRPIAEPRRRPETKTNANNPIRGDRRP